MCADVQMCAESGNCENPRRDASVCGLMKQHMLLHVLLHVKHMCVKNIALS